MTDINNASNRLTGSRVLVTQADAFMGPATIERFTAEGAEVIADTRDPRDNSAAAEAVAAAGQIDVMILNLAGENHFGTATTDLADDAWNHCFDYMVHPLHRYCRAVLPQMIARKAGKIVVFGSSVALRGMGRLAAYSAARGAQHAYVRSVGVEVARHNVQINLIAQNWVSNPAYYPPELEANPKFQQNLKAQVPLGRLARSEEDVAFALFLASNESDFFVGQNIAFDGGWSR